MDEATPQAQILLGNNSQCSKDSDILAIIAYYLVAMFGHRLKVGRSTYEIIQILSISLRDKTPIKEILTGCDYNDVKEL